MAPLLALASAALYGIVDFAGGLLSRRVHFAVVTLLGQVGGLLLALVVAFVAPTSEVRLPDVLWGALSGIGSGAAMTYLNRGLSRGSMSVVVPVSAVTGVALSVLCGVFLLGDRPAAVAWLGIGVTLPALWLVSGGGRGAADSAAGAGAATGSAGDGGDRAGAAGTGAAPSGLRTGATLDGLLASLGVAVQYLGLAQAGAGSGVWPVVAGRVAAVALLLPGLWRHAGRFRQPPEVWGKAAAIGAGAALALILYLWAAQRQMLSVVVVLASLYPAVPTVLGLTALHERVNIRQTVGLVGAALAILLLTLG
ncbi:EamA family transporter [Streptomyces sp. DSM 40750]|uniref:EamA family transporter n=1 Tax=Streptomyces sp. DSM 40750 TaxID=2801030 RepID=UPI00214B1E8C|nr:EamA family transporter [Streptomyces sp. DSM 40750]UUU26623.1 EamA family transporter [Streptomyces sp. DSM 40750]